jgi:CheY-like chemotaxis protein
MTTESRPRILCVDDEPEVLNGITLHLRRKYEIEMASSGPLGLEKLKAPATRAQVVISDMRMPGMNGAEFLTQVKEKYPECTRMLLTGQADVASAASAVNDGQIFRFLTKPCPPPVLLAAVDAAVQMHRLMSAERVLLEQTLHGCVKMLMDVLAMTSPASFGRANRIKKHVSKLADKVGIRDRWQLEVAAMLSQLGSIVLPAETLDRLYFGGQLSPEEEEMVAAMPATTDNLLANIPRLEGVRQLLSDMSLPLGKGPLTDLGRGSQMLRVAADYDALELAGEPASAALATLRGREGVYDAEVLQAFAFLAGKDAATPTIRTVAVAALAVGMVLAEDLKMTTGAILVARGFEVTESFLQRIANMRSGTLVLTAKVRLK